MQGLLMPDSVLLQTHGFEDDFHATLSGFTNSGTVAHVGEAGGVITLTTGTTANNEAFRHETAKTFLLAAGKPLRFRARVSFVDASTTTGALFVGISSEAGAALVANGGAAMKAGAQTTLGFAKFTGQSTWTCYSKVNATDQSDVLSEANKGNLSGRAQTLGSYQVLGIDFLPDSPTTALATYTIDDIEVCKHRISLASAAIAAPILFVKTTTTDAQVLRADLWSAFQNR